LNFAKTWSRRRCSFLLALAAGFGRSFGEADAGGSLVHLMAWI
jgi:hypothetical protein